MNISFDTYRDKTLPGSEEKWKVKISGNKGEKLLPKCWRVCMMHHLTSLNRMAGALWISGQHIPGYNTWGSSQNFSSIQSVEKYWDEQYFDKKEKKYDALNYITGYNECLSKKED